MKSFEKHLFDSLQLKGLYDVKPGDYIKLGIEGHRNKINTRIEKIVGNDRLQDINGNIFDRNGMIYRRSSNGSLQSTKDKIVYASPITQKEFDEDYKRIKINFLRNYEWDKEDITKIEEVISLLKAQQGNRLQTSRF